MNHAGAVDLYPDFSPKHWTETCVPLVQDGKPLAAARARVINRALSLGWLRPAAPQPVLLADGKPVQAIQCDGKRWRYPIAARVKTIRLTSGSGVPAELLPNSQDRRRLGLWIDGIAIIRGGQLRQMSLTDAALTDGWHDVERSEPGTWRWTNGDAGLAVVGPCELEISVGSSLPYWDVPAADRAGTCRIHITEGAA